MTGASPLRCATLLLLGAMLPAQDPKAPAAYPERDILSPFRTCDGICGPPDAAFVQLRAMRAIAEHGPATHSFDAEGREIVDDERWRSARTELERIGLDAGWLARIVRESRNGDERDLAFYGAFFCSKPDDIFNLIAHIPGEPARTTREKAYPRAIAYVRANIGRTWGDLTPEQQKLIQEKMPQLGSATAKAMGITRAPRPEDTLHQLNLKPFFQLLDLDEADDQAQGLWFLKECFLARKELAVQWLEPALPRVHQLLLSPVAKVREQAVQLLLAIAGEGVEAPAADADNDALLAFAKQAERRAFPPLRHLGEGLMLLFPSPERDAIATAGKRALQAGSLGRATNGKGRDGTVYRGLLVTDIPAELAPLRFPSGAVITAVNGRAVDDCAQLLQLLEGEFVARNQKGATHPVSRRNLLVEYWLDGSQHAIEYRVL